jgi:hypothetical protein
MGTFSSLTADGLDDNGENRKGVRMSIQAPASARPAVATGVVTGVKVGNYRWYVCGLLFFASVINYIDRQVIGILKPTLQQQYGWSELDYGDIVFSFQLAYAIRRLASVGAAVAPSEAAGRMNLGFITRPSLGCFMSKSRRWS